MFGTIITGIISGLVSVYIYERMKIRSDMSKNKLVQCPKCKTVHKENPNLPLGRR